MKRYKTSNLVLINIYLLIPLLLYGLYKNGYLIYEKKLISLFMVFKPLYLVASGIIVKIIIDLIKYKKIKLDYNLLIPILVGMIMPYNINIIVYILGFAILYIITLLLSKVLKFNKVCFIYLVLVLINLIFNNFSYQSILELKYEYSFSFLDLFVGRSIGGISSTCALFSLMAYVFLVFNYYYKREIPFTINISYLLLAFIYFIITKESNLLLNNELIFGSIFVAAFPLDSPYSIKKQIVYGISIGIISFIMSLTFNSIISIYIAIFIASLFQNVELFLKK